MSRIALLVGSVYGGAEDVADNAKTLLTKAGHEANIFTDTSLDEVLKSDSDIWIVITSTTGQGDIPDNIAEVFCELKDSTPNLKGKFYAVICMGDSSYFNTFCEAGKQFDEIMFDTMAKRIVNRLEIDACETAEPFEVAEPWLVSLNEKIAETA